jgi:predicted outer membrane protein
MFRFLTGAALSASVAALTLSAGTAHAGTASTVSALDEQYLMTSIEGDRFEVAGGQQALAKSQNAAVKLLAARLVKDHSKSLKEATAIAKTLGIKVPKTPSPSMQWELSVLNTMSGATYDHWYSSLEVKDHVQDISEAHAETSKGTNATIRHSAGTEVPILQKHLTLSRAALKASPAT